MADMQTIDEMREAYKDEWVFVVDCEYDESRRLLRGRAAAHSPRRSDVYKYVGDHHDGGAIEYFGEVPEDLVLML